MIWRVAWQSVHPMFTSLLRSSVLCDCFAFVRFTLSSSVLIPYVAFQPDLQSGIRVTPFNNAILVKKWYIQNHSRSIPSKHGLLNA